MFLFLLTFFFYFSIQFSESRNPPLPLDLDVPYNDDLHIISRIDETTNDPKLIQNNRNLYNNIIQNNISRPSHKTHVEIMTKNGATKKPNIIVNNYNPDVILTSTNFHQQQHHHHHHTKFNEIIDSTTTKSAYDRKITCMLYLQADHTFFQKMGSDDASIEAITRHVQRANAIYKITGKRTSISFLSLFFLFMIVCAFVMMVN